jgi:ATP-dependent DNA helicase RecG
LLNQVRTKGVRYFVDPELLNDLNFPTQTDFTRIEPYCLRELIREDLNRHPGSGFGEIHQRVGEEIPAHQIRLAIRELAEKGDLRAEGNTRARRYWYLKK